MRPEVTLAIDTSAAHCAAALLFRGREVEAFEEMATGQAERLMPMVEALLAGQGLGWPDVTLLAVGTGPGNFTGVRIAVAAARGLALGLGVPLVGVTSLQALRFGHEGALACLDARRGAVYVQGEGAAALAEWEELSGFSPAFTVGYRADDLALRFGGTVLPTPSLVLNIARVAAAGQGGAPAPFYLRGADALPPSDPPPVIL
ncbi:tRNA (adenosine(37)-N6)-threonylcarbamoyltransferase complex dimerization subunit type 1 TsaB [Stagnihabitans tardus]|uniref:tRNA (Adenosine(37)-N6)-threonylcarbamoyltransferase complex dimerization subunit type 1 TsaB n=1 Tax=Stagnihabitans tardus TaxID=2699202 RepID=A0AAE4YF54_9RHOB|nr:tRNA (adenosine(37)-N6)-threonylcarbamoyltransferase complex dimerization subunit type 1 TsaB [Stagnihabitans tardus]NBZ88545.1 tRNA (adenosine(37)-N6)-threonylcarbamoyltransferase complex dimerization subunit type 1 TsaB [Stagnihabitans tardus]